MSLATFLALLLLVGCVESSVAPQTITPSALRLMTYNLNYGNPRPETSIAAIENANADLVLLQEITAEWRDRLQKRFTTQYPHQVYRIDGRASGGLAVLSKLPLRDEQLWNAPAGTGAWFPAQRFQIDLAMGPVQVLNVHLRPALESGSWIKGFFTTPPIRRAEIAAHWKRMDGKLPTIVAGDFNEDPDGLALEFLKGQGLARIPTTGPTTWHYEVTSKVGTTDMLKMDIDHVVVDGRFVAKDAQVIDAGASDHRPVIVTLTGK